ncbi:hypothetical protein HMI55_003943 [Coelomomyces lativittatus]|nr:hypothetical protein HMI55_003943 [Coelomomyces lativittatus]
MQGSTQFQHPSTYPLPPPSHSNLQSSSNEWLALFKKHGGEQDDKTEQGSFGFASKSLPPHFQNSAPSHPPNMFQQRPPGMSGHPHPLFNSPGTQYFVDPTSSHRGNGGPKFPYPNMSMMMAMPGQPGQYGYSQGMMNKPREGGDPNRWVPGFLKYPEEDTTVVNEEEKYLKGIEKETRGFLNKISSENLEQLAPFFYRPEKYLSALKLKIYMIVKKSFDEPKYATVYAQLANGLLQHCKPLQGSASGDKEFEEIRKNVRKFIIISCESSFKTRPKWADKMYPKITEEDYEEVTKIKGKVLGNMRFVAELFNYKVLSPTAMSKIVNELLRNTQTPTEEDLECLIVLLNTAGPSLSTLKEEDDWFKKIDMILKLANTIPRIRFLLMDLLALKKNDWRKPDAEELSKQLKEYNTTDTHSAALTTASTTSSKATTSSSKTNAPSQKEGWMPATKSKKGNASRSPSSTSSGSNDTSFSSSATSSTKASNSSKNQLKKSPWIQQNQK